MGCVLTPQTRDRGAARAHPMARAFHGPIGSGGAMSWWRRWPTHGERGLKPLEGRAAAAHFDCCVLWLCGCVVVSRRILRGLKILRKKKTFEYSQQERASKFFVSGSSYSGIQFRHKSLSPEIWQNSKKNLERPPTLAPKLGILRAGYIRAAKFQVFFGMSTVPNWLR